MILCHLPIFNVKAIINFDFLVFIKYTDLFLCLYSNSLLSHNLHISVLSNITL